MCTVKSFVLLVKKMRDTQNAWLESKKQGNGKGELSLLMQLKALEKDVDAIIAATDVNFFERKDSYYKDLLKNIEILMASMRTLAPTITITGKGTEEKENAVKLFNEASSRLQYLITLSHI